MSNTPGANATGEAAPTPSPQAFPPSPLPTTAYPPLPGFGTAHDFGSVTAVSGTDAAGGATLTLDRLAYIHCTPQPNQLEECLDGYRVEPVDAGRRQYPVASTVKVTLVVQPEMYRDGTLADLRTFVAERPSNLMLLRLDEAGRVVAVGQPWVP
ncbi:MULTISPECIES: hypothetical protein [unclassified Frankia]|uniref:hypothetical protein n=1 Tax=unclassified Frankia TaxID=2632575 RepID=UPI001F1AF8FA|nr:MULTISPECIES: hypothetical protein [unclassified Frankia]